MSRFNKVIRPKGFYKEDCLWDALRHRHDDEHCPNHGNKEDK